jgi:hypothetical protein
MAALSAVAPVLNKAPVVSTGKAANTNSMMVWQPHGNKCVPAPTAIPGFFLCPIATAAATSALRDARCKAHAAAPDRRDHAPSNRYPLGASMRPAHARRTPASSSDLSVSSG